MVVFAGIGAPSLFAQTPAATPQAAATARRPMYPTAPPADPAVIDHGKQIYNSNCGFCHGADARGGETGPNLVRSQVVLDDRQGESISPVVQNGRPDRGMPKFDLPDADVKAVAAYLHSLMAAVLPAPINIVVGDASAGEAYFNGPGKCATCHSITGDFAGIGAKYDPKTLQNLIVSGGYSRKYPSPGSSAAPATPSAPPTTVTVILGSKQTVEGKLDHMDAFNVTLTDANGARRSFALDNRTKVEVHNPFQAHIDMLAQWSDSDIHNLTAYLAKIK
jgi:mono/diheme cytochrome c family protein